MIRKAVILARGLGKRMRAEINSVQLDQQQLEIASQGIKALMPIVDNKTMLDFSLDSLIKAGYSEFCLVIGPEHQVIRDYCSKFDYPISFAVQEKPLGTANAVLAAEEFSNGQSFLVINSDNLYPSNDLAKLRNVQTSGLIAFDKQHLIVKSNIDEEKINNFAVLNFDGNGNLTKIIEKPEKTEKEAFISMNAWLFANNIFLACRKIKLSQRGEYELADAVNFAIENLDEKFKVVFSQEGVLDLTSREDVEKLRENIRING